MRAHAELQPPARLRRLDAMLQRVLGQWLKQETRDEGVERVGVNVEVDRQALVEPHARDVQIALQQLELLPQCHLLHLGIHERRAQQATESRDHRVGARRVAIYLLGDRGERVEEEVRPELRLQRVQPGGIELRLQLCSSQRLLTRERRIVCGVRERDDDEVPAEVEHELLRQVYEE